MGNKCIEECLVVVHLGIKLNADMNTTIWINDMCNTGKGIVFSLSQVGVRSGGLSPLTSANIWSKVALPAITYGCELWQLNATNLEQLAKTQKICS